MAGKTAKLSLPPSFSAAAAADVHARMQVVLEGRNPVYIDLSRCTTIDTAGLQLLVVFVNALRAAGREYSMSEMDTAVTNAMALGGFASVLGVPGDARAG